MAALVHSRNIHAYVLRYLDARGVSVVVGVRVLVVVSLGWWNASERKEMGEERCYQRGTGTGEDGRDKVR